MEGHDLRHLLNIARRRSWLALGVAVVGTLLAVVLSLQMTQRYTASATILIDPRQTTVVESEAVLSGLGRDTAAIESEAQLIRSSAIALRVVDKLDLLDSAEFKPAGGLQIGRLVRSLFGAEEPADPVYTEDDRVAMARRLSGGLTVGRRNQTYLISVAFTHENPRIAARIANGFADAYLVDQLEAKFEATKRANDWLNDRVAELRDRVQAAEQAVATFRAENNLIEAAGASLGDQQLAQLNQQLIQARAEAAAARAKLDKFVEVADDGGDVTSFADALQVQVITQLRAKLSDVKREYADLSTKYGVRHPSVITVRAQLGDVQSQLNGEVGKIRASVENQYAVAKSRADSVQASLRELTGGNALVDRKEVQLRELQREADLTRTLYESFLARFKQTTAQESLQTPDSRIVERATPPGSPSEPNRLAIVLVGFVLSLAAGAGLAYLMELLDNGFRSAAQLEAEVGAPVLASVPSIEGGPARSLKERFAGWTSRFTGNSRAIDKASRSRRAISVRWTLEKPLSPFTEAIRSTRMGIRYAGIDHEVKVVMVTSALPGEGKSTIASNLALHAAAAGERVLLIDMDLRHPALSDLYTPGSKDGFVELLTGEKQLGDVVRSEEETRMRFLPASRTGSVSHSAEILGSAKLRKMLESFREAFDLIIIDSPPLLPVVDSRALIGTVDGVVLVVQWGKTSTEAVSSAIRQTFGIEQKLIGTVMSQVETSRARYYNYYESGYAKKYPYYYYGGQ